MSTCLVSLRELPDGERFHPDALQVLFGTRRVPSVDVDVARLHTFGLAMVGKTTLSGVQRKISLGLDVERAMLRVSVEGRQYVLKPPSDTFPELPQNEHSTMHLARVCGIDVPPFGLIPVGDGAIAYIAQRFDRPLGGGKLRQEDFCQLAGQYPADKYRGSHELCARLVRRYASEPVVELRRLYRRALFCWWTGNGDMHLKNFSLLTGPDGLHRLSPAYDLLCTRLYIRDDRLALPVGGRDDTLTARDWRAYAAYCGLPSRAAARVAAELVERRAEVEETVGRSHLSEALREAYRDILAERAPLLDELAGR